MDVPKFTLINYVSIFGSIAFISAIVLLIRNKRLKEEYSLLWLFFGFLFLLLAVYPKTLTYLAQILGIVYPPAALFLILIIAIISILIHFSAVLSKTAETNKNLVQEIALLRLEIEEKQPKINDKNDF